MRAKVDSSGFGFWPGRRTTRDLPDPHLQSMRRVLIVRDHRDILLSEWHPEAPGYDKVSLVRQV
jgi:hypothetical protein